MEDGGWRMERKGDRQDRLEMERFRVTASLLSKFK